MPFNQNNDSAIKKFFSENKSLAYMLPILVALLILIVIIYSNIFKSDKTTANDVPTGTNTPVASNAGNSQSQVEVLPQVIRSSDEDSVVVAKDPFEAPLKLTGIVYSETRPVAIVESGGISYIVGMNDNIGDSAWIVTKIEEDTLILEYGNESVVLELDDTADASQGQ